MASKNNALSVLSERSEQARSNPGEGRFGTRSEKAFLTQRPPRTPRKGQGCTKAFLGDLGPACGHVQAGLELSEANGREELLVLFARRDARIDHEGSRGEDVSIFPSADYNC